LTDTSSSRADDPAAPGQRERVRVRRRPRGPLRRAWDRYRFPLLSVALLIVLGAVAVGIDIGTRYLPALRALQDGRDAALQAAALLRDDSAHLDAARLDQARALLAKAQDDFGSRSQILATGSSGWVLAHLPWVSGQVEAARALRTAGAAAVQLGADLTPLVEQVLAKTDATAGDGVLTRLATVADHQKAALDRVRTDMTSLTSAVAGLPHGSLLGPLDKARATFNVETPKITGALDPVITLLGALPRAVGSGTHNYLVLLSNSGEERPGGGFIGAVGEVTLTDDRLAGASFKGSEFAKPLVTSIPAPRPLDTYLFHGHPWELADANWSPDFPTSAAEVARFYSMATGHRVNGVIEIDPVALGYVLDVLGPVQVPSLSAQTVTGGNALLVLNELVNGGPTQPGKAYLPPFGQAVLDRILHAPVVQMPSLANALSRAIGEKHLVIHVDDPLLQQLVDDHGAAGRLGAPLSDALLVADANLSGTKGDLFVQRHFDLVATVEANGQVHDHLVLSYANPLPTSAIDLQMVKDSGSAYRDYVQVVVPETAQLDRMTVSINGESTTTTPESVEYVNHREVIAYWLVIPANGQAALTIDYSGPFADITYVPERYSLVWDKQLNALPWPASLTVVGPGGSRTRWSGDLAVNRSVRVEVH
jgi:hypothetical protein